jgi:hypothetical protein
MDAIKPNLKGKREAKLKQPPPYQPVEAPPLNIVTFSFRPLQANKLDK